MVEKKAPKALRKLWKLEDKSKKGKFSNFAIGLNKAFMHKSYKKKLERYAKKESITLDEAIGRALDVTERLHKHTNKEWTGIAGNLNLILLGTEKPVYNLHRLRHLIEVGVPEGKMPTNLEEVNNLIGEDRYWDAVGYQASAKVVIKKGPGSYLIFDGSGGESLQNAKGAAYGKETSDFALKVLKGKKLNKTDIGVIVHEVGESLGEIEYDYKHTLENPTEREKEIRKDMLSKLKTIFPEYY